jgi:hypothetical protein
VVRLLRRLGLLGAEVAPLGLRRRRRSLGVNHVAFCLGENADDDAALAGETRKAAARFLQQRSAIRSLE